MEQLSQIHFKIEILPWLEFSQIGLKKKASFQQEVGTQSINNIVQCFAMYNLWQTTFFLVVVFGVLF